MTENDKDNENGKRDDVDWLRDAFDRAVRGDNGTAPDTSRPVINPFAGLTPAGGPSVPPETPVVPAGETPPAQASDSARRHDLDLDFETDNMPPVTAFEPVVPLDRPLPSIATDYPPTEALDAVDLPPVEVPKSVKPAAAPPAAPPAVAPASNPSANGTTGVDQLNQMFASTESSAATIPLVSPPVPGSPRGARAKRSETTPRESTPEDQAKLRQKLLLTVGGILVAFVMGGAWVVGGIVATPAATPEPTETAAPALPTATQPPGDYPFGELYGGECLNPFVDAWAETFTVVDCATPHAAQVVYAGNLAVDGTYPSYPGDSRIGKAALAACSREDVLDLSAAKKITDLQISAAYSASSVAWDSGDTRYYCFASRTSATPLDASIAGSLMTQSDEPTPEATPSD
jgi:hypothetical protein